MRYINFTDNSGNKVLTNEDFNFLVKDLTPKIIKRCTKEDFFKIIDDNSLSIGFRLYSLYEDESIKEDISKYILEGGNLSINYNCGIRRKLSIRLYNAKKWVPNPYDGFLWKGSKFKLEILYRTTLAEYVFSAGVFILQDFEFPHKYQNNEINLEMVDKFGGLDGTVGGKIVDNIYIPRGSNIVKVVKSLLSSEKIEGVSFDIKTPIFPQWMYETTTPYTINETSDSTIGSLIIKIMATINSEVFYNEDGHLCVCEMKENMLVNYAPSIWDFSETDGLYGSHGTKVNLQSIENIVIVEGGNINGDIVNVRSENTNPKSPTNIKIFEPRIKKIVDENISNIAAAKLRADYELFKSSVVPIENAFSTIIIPFLDVNNVITINDKYCGLKNAKFLINSINIPITNCPKMDISISNLEEVAFNVV